MAINVSNINTGGATVTIGGTVNSEDGDGYYIGTSGGTNVGCTQGGVSISYSYEVSDIYCDQTLAPVESAIINETAEIEMELLESNSENLRYALSQYVSSDDASDKKTGVGGITTVNYQPIMLEINDNDDTSKKTTWTFFRTRPNGPEINFERENPTAISVTFQAYADTTHTSGHQLFSVNEQVVS